MIRLKRDVDYRKLLEKVKECEGDVILRTSRGDILNLKSEVTGYVVLFLENKEELSEDAALECRIISDEERLKEFSVSA